MKTIGIVSAMDEEISFLLQKFNNVKEKEINNFKFYITSFGNLNFVISKSGIGKTAAGMLLATLNNNFKVDAVINTGICGGRLNKSKLGDIIVMDKCLYGDFDISPITDNCYGQVSGMPRYFESDYRLKSIASNAIIGDLLTSDAFVTDYDDTETLIENYFYDYNICGYDMESAAFAHACYFFKIPFIAIRATSDVVGVTSTEEYNENEVDLCKVSSEYLFNYLKRLDS